MNSRWVDHQDPPQPGQWTKGQHPTSVRGVSRSDPAQVTLRAIQRPGMPGRAGVRLLISRRTLVAASAAVDEGISGWREAHGTSTYTGAEKSVGRVS